MGCSDCRDGPTPGQLWWDGWVEVLVEPLDVDWFEFRNDCFTCALKRLGFEPDLVFEWFEISESGYIELRSNDLSFITQVGLEFFKLAADNHVTRSDLELWKYSLDSLSLSAMVDVISRWREWGMLNPLELFRLAYKNLVSCSVEDPPPISLKTRWGMELLDLFRWESTIRSHQWRHHEDLYEYSCMFESWDWSLLEDFLEIAVPLDQTMSLLASLTWSFCGDEDKNSGDLPEMINSLNQAGLPLSEANLEKWWGLSSVEILELIDSGMTDSVSITGRRLGVAHEQLEIFKTLHADLSWDDWIAANFITAGLTLTDWEWLTSEDLIDECVCLVTDNDGLTPEVFRSMIELGFDASDEETLIAWWSTGMTPQDAANWRRDGFRPDEALAWNLVGITPEVARRRQGQGIKPPTY